MCDDDKLPKQPNGASAALDLSVDSLSQADSLDANWGSVSGKLAAHIMFYCV